jgi:hypothetical protein
MGFLWAYRSPGIEFSRMLSTIVSYPPAPGPDGRFVPTGLSFRSEYDHAGHPEEITIKRKDLERCLRTAIEETMCWGGTITTIANKYMQDMDRLACDARGAE